MMKAQQISGMPLTGQQATMMPFQTGTLPATTAAQIDLTAIMNLMMMMMIMVMMVKMMGKATAGI